MTKYKIGKLNHAVALCPGDKFNLTFTEKGGQDPDGSFYFNEKLLHSEEITEAKDYNCYAVLKTPVGIGILMGSNIVQLTAWLVETFPGGLCAPDEAIL